MNFIYLIKTLYNETTTAVINNRNISKWFKPERGMRQGCPTLPYSFILTAEILSSKIGSLNDIKGIVWIDWTHGNITTLRVVKLGE